MDRRWNIFFWSLVVLASPLIIGYLFGPGWFVLGLSIDCFLFWLFKRTWWAKNNFMYTFVSEGTAKIITKDKGYVKTLINWKDHILNKDGEVVDQPKHRRRKGGLFFYGFWPIYDVLIYAFSWEDEKGFHAERLIDYVLLKSAVYVISVKDVEDKNLFPLDIDFYCKIRVTNPYIAIYNIQWWLPSVTTRIKSRIRGIISTKIFKDWLDNTQELADMVEGDRDKIYQEFGVLIEGVKIKNINPAREDHKEALAKEKKSEMEGMAIKVLARAERERLQEIAEAMKGDDTTKLLRILEAVEKGNSNWILPPEITQIIKGFLSK